MQQLSRLVLGTLMVTVLFIAAFGAIGAAPATLPPVEQAYRTAAQLYANGDYTEAAQSYQQLIDQGYGDSALYYNLGQAYFQANNPARALWALRTAQELAPRDADINLALEQAHERLAQTEGAAEGTVLQSTAAATDPIGMLQEAAGRWLSLDELAILALLLWTGFVALMLLALFSDQGSRRRRWARLASLGIGACLIIASLTLGSRLIQPMNLQEAVVVAGPVELSNGPGAEYQSKITLPQGVEVSVTEARGEWVHVEFSESGASGWAPAEAVAMIAPYGLSN
jgi:tetratricopeptide (TPR) repeat protein